jgi:HK97 family phage major capsid protein
MSTEEQIVQKADLVLADLTSNGGLLNPEQSDRFMRVLIESPTILSAARTIPMNSPTMKINKIGFGSRILRPAVENTALVASDRSKPTTTQLSLTTKEVIAEVRIPYGVLEDNIEKADLENTILNMIGERAALDIEELVLLGDIGSGDPYLALMDGVVKRFVTRVVNASTTLNTAQTYSNALKALPPRYRRNLSLLKLFMAPDQLQDYRQVVAARQTSLGDQVVFASPSGAGLQMYVHGIQMDFASLMPVGTAILTNPQNIVIGIQRNFQIESQRLISERQIKIVLTARLALTLETEDSGVKIINIP